MLNSILADMMVSIVISILSAVACIYCFISLKRTSKVEGMSYLSNFALAFFFYFLSNVSGYLSAGMFFFMGDAVASEYFDLYLSLPGYICTAIALMFFVVGVNKSKLLRPA